MTHLTKRPDIRRERDKLGACKVRRLFAACGDEIIIAGDDVPVARLADARARAKFVTRDEVLEWRREGARDA
jgi:hypothetical protein